MTWNECEVPSDVRAALEAGDGRTVSLSVRGRRLVIVTRPTSDTPEKAWSDMLSWLQKEGLL